MYLLENLSAFAVLWMLMQIHAVLYFASLVLEEVGAVLSGAERSLNKAIVEWKSLTCHAELWDKVTRMAIEASYSFL